VALHVHHFCCAKRPFPIQLLRHFQQLPQPAYRSKTKTFAAARSFYRNLELILPGVGEQNGRSRPPTSFLNVQPGRSTCLNFALLRLNGSQTYNFQKLTEKLTAVSHQNLRHDKTIKELNGRFLSKPFATLQTFCHSPNLLPLSKISPNLHHENQPLFWQRTTTKNLQK
jgi:hypothetical protein